MGTSQTAIFAAYRNQAHAERAKQQLLAAGFSEKCICLLPSPKGGGKYFHEQTRTRLKTGALIGALVGGSAFLIVGIALSLSIFLLPGHHTHSLSPVATRVALTLTGVAIGALVGMVAGMLVGIGTPEGVGQRFAGYAKGGASILSVEISNSTDSARVTTILEQSGGSDVTEMNEKQGWKIIHEALHDERSRPDESNLLNDQIP